MVLVLFEATIKEGGMDDYLAAAYRLKKTLVQAKGFLRSERFSSLAEGQKLLSLSVWENEEAVREWRNQQEHRKSQQAGRASIFEHYTITVVSPLRRYTDQRRRAAPADSNQALYLTTDV